MDLKEKGGQGWVPLLKRVKETVVFFFVPQDGGTIVRAAADSTDMSHAADRWCAWFILFCVFL
jgi:hypothetical protein